MEQKRFTIHFIFLSVLLIILFFINISLGSVSIPLKSIFNSIIGSSENESWQYIVQNYRLPKAFTAVLVGSGLGISGLLMQTLFNNPLAGPYVLGINSGSSLFVALSIMTGIPFFTSDFGIITNALIGAFLFGLVF